MSGPHIGQFCGVEPGSNLPVVLPVSAGLRPPWSVQLVTPAVFLLGAWGWAVGMARTTDVGSAGRLSGWLLPILVWSWIIGRDRMTLTPHEVVVHSFRRRAVPWPQVDAVTVARRGPVHRVVLWTVDGERIDGVPVAWTRRGGERARHQVRQWWVLHRGTEWMPGHRWHRYQL